MVCLVQFELVGFQKAQIELFDNQPVQIYSKLHSKPYIFAHLCA